LRGFLSKHPFAAIFLLALTVRIAHLLFFVSIESLFLEDQALYQDLARNYLQDGWAALGLERLPLYPIFLSLFLGIIGEEYWLQAVLFFQSIIDAITCVLIAKLVFEQFGKGVWFAGLIAVLNPNQVILSGMVLTDTLYLFFIAGFLLFFARYLRTRGLSPLLMAVLWLGTSALVRPTSFYLILLVIFLLFIDLWRRDVRSFANGPITIMGLMLPMLMFPASIYLKNYLHHQDAVYVSQGGTHLLNWVVPATYQYSGLGSYDEGRAFARSHLDKTLSKASDLEVDEEATAAAISALKEMGILRVARAWVVGSMVNLLGPSVAFSPAIRALPHASFYESGGSGLVQKVRNFIAGSSASYVLVLLVGSLGSVIFALLAMIGWFAVILRQGPIRLWIFLTLFIGLFLGLTGPVIGTKYRLPLEPALIFFQVVAIYRLRDWLKNASSH